MSVFMKMLQRDLNKLPLFEAKALVVAFGKFVRPQSWTVQDVAAQTLKYAELGARLPLAASLAMANFYGANPRTETYQAIYEALLPGLSKLERMEAVNDWPPEPVVGWLREMRRAA